MDTLEIIVQAFIVIVVLTSTFGLMYVMAKVEEREEKRRGNGPPCFYVICVPSSKGFLDSSDWEDLTGRDWKTWMEAHEGDSFCMAIERVTPNPEAGHPSLKDDGWVFTCTNTGANRWKATRPETAVVGVGRSRSEAAQDYLRTWIESKGLSQSVSVRMEAFKHVVGDHDVSRHFA